MRLKRQNLCRQWLVPCLEYVRLAEVELAFRSSDDPVESGCLGPVPSLKQHHPPKRIVDHPRNMLRVWVQCERAVRDLNGFDDFEPAAKLLHLSDLVAARATSDC